MSGGSDVIYSIAQYITNHSKNEVNTKEFQKIYTEFERKYP